MTAEVPSLFQRFFAVVLTAALAWPAFSQEAPVKHALLIGINRYASEIENVPRLRFARADAEELKRQLLDRGWDARAVIDDEATRRRIVSELVRLAIEAKPQDTVLIYFAGHGLRDKRAREHTYWLTYPSTLASLAVDGLRLSHLMEYIGDIPAERRVVILDHCHSGDVERIARTAVFGGDGSGGGGGEEARGIGDGRPHVTRNLFPLEAFTQTVTASRSQGVVVLGSARDDAYEFDDIGHGMFTHGLLSALQDPQADIDHDAKLSFQELWTYARDEMQRIAGLKQVTQEPIEITQGRNLSSWNDLFEAALDTGEAFAEEADSLTAFVTQLDLNVPLDLVVRANCISAIHGWLNARSSTPSQDPDAADLAIVNELRALRGLAFPWDTKKTLLEAKVRALKGL